MPKIHVAGLISEERRASELALKFLFLCFFFFIVVGEGLASREGATMKKSKEK